MTSSSRGRAAARVAQVIPRTPAQGASIPRTPPGGPIVRSPGGPMVRVPAGPIVRVPAGPIVPSPGGGLTPWIQRIGTGAIGAARSASLLNPLVAAATVLSTAYGIGDALYNKARKADEKNNAKREEENQRIRAGGFDPNGTLNFNTGKYTPSSTRPTRNSAGSAASSSGGNINLGPSSRENIPPSLLRPSRIVSGFTSPTATEAINSGAATPEQVNQYQESVNAAQAFQNQSESLT